MCISEILPNISAHNGSSRGFVHAGPGPIVSSLVLERVGVGGLLDRRGEPVAGVAVRPGVHACRQVAVLLWDAVQHPVDHGHSLGTGDVGIRAEGAVLEALDPAQARWRAIYCSAQCPSMSEKACVSLISPVWNRAQMAANCARVVGALGSKVSVLHPCTMPRPVMVEMAVFVLFGFHFLIKASIVICYAHSEHLLQNRNSRLISFENQAAMYVVYSAVKTRRRVQIGGISSYRYYL